VNTDRRGVGKHWESVAADFLGKQGLAIVARGYTCRLGEIDIVATHDDTLVIVEVRYRRNCRFGSASESVESRKQARILRAARHFLMLHPQYASCPMRFDIIAIDGRDGRSAGIDWLQNAFDGA
jgi:putative endonuclease